MKSRIAQILLLSLLLVAVPAYAQEATEAAIATVEPFAPLSLGTAAETPEAAAAEGEATATVEAIAAVETATAEATALVEGAAAETRPVAGISAEGATENPAPGATVLVLLVGVGAVGLVGFAALMRENYKAPEE